MNIQHYLEVLGTAAVAMLTLSVPIGMLGHAFAEMPYGWAKRVGSALEGLGSNIKQIAGAFKPAAKEEPK